VKFLEALVAQMNPKRRPLHATVNAVLDHIGHALEALDEQPGTKLAAERLVVQTTDLKGRLHGHLVSSHQG
jgi:hypothetical protein